MMKTILLLLYLLFIAVTAHSQDFQSPFFRNPEKDDRFEAGVPMLTGFASPVFTPELKLSLKASGAFSFKFKRNNDYLQHSYLPFEAEMNTNGSFRLMSQSRFYWFDDFLMALLDFRYYNMDDHFWGVGMAKASEIEQGEMTTFYRREETVVHPSLLFRTISNIYVGFTAEINNFNAMDAAPLLNEDPAILSHGTEISSRGLGLLSYYKPPVYSAVSKATGFRAEFMNYTGIIGSGFNFKKAELLVRQQYPVIRDGSAVNVQIHASAIFGDVPWNMLSQPKPLAEFRGVYQGRYRDRNSVSVYAEYRHIFLKKNSENLSRHGVVYWMGGSAVFSKFSDISQAVFVTGAGYLYRIHPFINLRFDLGFGTENVGFYFGLYELF